jgi:F-type H+-transporting ATPase subunit b
MLIDWFTVCAQIVNFLLLIWLLKHFMYKPILRAMDAREQKIALQIRDAETRKAEAEIEREHLRSARTEFETQKEALLRQASDEAEITRKRLGDQVRQEIETLRTKWLETLRQDQETLRGELANRVQREVFAIARQALRDLAGKQLEQQIVLVFLRQLKALNGNEKETLATILKVSRTPVLIRSAFDLPAPERTDIESTIRETLVPNAGVRFETASNLIGGIEMTANGHKVSWSISEYLSTLEAQVREVVEHKTSPDEQSK